MSLLLMFSLTVQAVEVVPLPDGRIAVVLSQDEIKRCKEQGGCNFVTLQEYQHAIAKQCKQVEVQYNALHGKWPEKL
jgi:hypothetical protein